MIFGFRGVIWLDILLKDFFEFKDLLECSEIMVILLMLLFLIVNFID